MFFGVVMRQICFFIFIAFMLVLPGCGSFKKKSTVQKSAVKKPGSALYEMAKQAPVESRKNLKSLSFAELQRLKEYYMQREDADKALLCVERMLALSADQIITRQLKLEHADLYFKIGAHEKAAKAYALYFSLYPGSADAPYALYKSMLALLYTSLSSDRDQSKTHATLQLAYNYLRAYKEGSAGYAVYEQEVKKIERQCAAKIIDSHMNIFEFYRKRGDYGAACARLAALKKEAMPLMQTIDPLIEAKLLLVEAKLHKEYGKDELALLKNQELALRFPTYQAELLAQANNAIPKKSYGQRF